MSDLYRLMDDQRVAVARMDDALRANDRCPLSEWSEDNWSRDDFMSATYALVVSASNPLRLPSPHYDLHPEPERESWSR